MYIPFNTVKAIHEETHSAYPKAPIVPHVPARPRRHPIRAVRRLLQGRKASPQLVWAELRTNLTVVSSTDDPCQSTAPLCDAEVC